MCTFKLCKPCYQLISLWIMYAFLETDIIRALGTWEVYELTQTAADVYLPTNIIHTHICSFLACNN